MQAIGPEVCLADEEDMRPVMLFRDWSVNGAHALVTHHPSGLTFEMRFDEAARAAGSLTVTAIWARPVHVCDGKELPPQTRMEAIAKEALSAFILVTGIGDKEPELEPGDDGIPF